MAAKNYIVKLNDITSADGVVCSNPIITFEKPTCANIVCELITQNVGAKTIRSIKIQVPEDCPDGCVYVKIDCSATCDTCGEQRIRICPCTFDSDCPDCNTCGADGYCITNCLDNEFCAGGNCVECDEFNPCKNGEVCESGKCKCPPSKPYKNQKGECVECNDVTPLSPCQTCVNGVIVAKTCPEGVLNPDTCICVSCVKDSDCVKPNEKCGPNGCECIDGFRRNPTTGDCEPSPDCVRDIDCGTCRKCLESGKCSDYTCPEGFTPSKIPGECCVKLCDCSNPSCPKGHKCINLDGTKCFCQNCNVKTIDGKCPEGCYSKDGQNCEPNPCSGKGDPNTPCPPGCGFNENGDCVPCETLSCDQCAKNPNCDCNTPDNCKPSDCAGPCDENNPCTGLNCGCTKERQCVDCRKIACLQNSDCPDGCDCLEDKKCGKSPCEEVNCTNAIDCGPECICDKGKCKKGTQGPNDVTCNDIITVKDNGDCTLKGSLTTKDCCQCIDVYLHANVQTTATDKTVQSSLRKGAAAGSTLLSATGIAGDSNISGQIRYTWNQVMKQVDSSGNVLPGGSVVNISNSVVTSFSNSDVSSITAGVKPNGALNVGGVYKITETTMYAESIGILTNNINGCTYKIGKTLIYRKTAAEAGNYSVLLDKVQRCKTPVFTWSKSSDGVSFTQLLKRYSTKAGSSFVDILKESDGLELCKYYKLSSDCGCGNKDTYYTCDDKNPTKFVPYIPKNLVVTQLDACGLSIKIKEQTVCSLFKPASLPWKLYVNGVFEQNINADANHKIFTGDLTITKTMPIKEVKLEYPCDDCLTPLIVTLPVLSSDCFICSNASTSLALAGTCATGITASGSVMQITNPLIAIPGCTLKFYLNGGASAIATAITDAFGFYNVVIPVPSGNATYTVKVVNCNSCEKSSTITITDCCDATINGLAYNCLTNFVTSTLSGCIAPGNFTIKKGNSVVHSGVYNNTIAVPFPLINGVYTFSVDCGGGCMPAKDFTVSCGIPDFNLPSTCLGLQGQITASGFTGGSGAPYLLEWSTDNFSSILGSSAVDPTVFNSNAGVNYQVRLKDSANNMSVVKTITGPDCTVNSFDFTTVMKCASGVQKFCFTPTVTNLYTVVVKDISNVTVFSGPVSGVAGVEVCTLFTTAPSAGVGSIAITFGGNTITKPITIAACASTTISYDCTLGLIVTGVSSFNVHSSGYPPNGYGPFLPTDNNLFFTDGISNSRTLTIKSPDGSETYGTVVINCCTHQIQVLDDTCVGQNARLKVSLNGIAGTYRITVFNGLIQVCTNQVSHIGGTIVYPMACNLTSSTTYSVQVENLDYESRTYKDALIGNMTCSVTSNYTSTNCGNSGGGNPPGCGLQASDIIITGGCLPSITNNSVYTITSALFKSTEFTNCTGQEITEGVAIAINPGQTVSYGALGHVNLGKKLYINYLGAGGDQCLVTICYPGCTGSSGCTLTVDPATSCDLVGAAAGNNRLGVTNNNSNAVFCEIDGVDKGVIGVGATIFSYYPKNTSHTIIFKCVDDVTKIKLITYLLNC